MSENHLNWCFQSVFGSIVGTLGCLWLCHSVTPWPINQSPSLYRWPNWPLKACPNSLYSLGALKFATQILPLLNYYYLFNMGGIKRPIFLYLHPNLHIFTIWIRYYDCSRKLDIWIKLNTHCHQKFVLNIIVVKIKQQLHGS